MGGDLIEEGEKCRKRGRGEREREREGRINNTKNFWKKPQGIILFYVFLKLHIIYVCISCIEFK